MAKWTRLLRDREANLDAAKLHEVVLVGGCARIPRLQAAVKDAFGKPPTIPKEKDSAARGAAVQVPVAFCHALLIANQSELQGQGQRHSTLA